MGQLRGARFGFLGAGCIAGGLACETDQVPILGLKRSVTASQVVGFDRQRFSLLILALVQTDLGQIVPNASVARLDAQRPFQGGAGLV
mgnify:FL=1